MKTKKIFPRLSGWNLLFIAGLCAAVSIIILSSVNFPVVNATGTISGRVFQDYNSNGAYDTTSGLNSIDRGVASVTVTAYDSTGVSRGTATTDASGNYSLSATGTGPYRLEFTNLPAGYAPSARSTDSALGGLTSDSGSTVQFVANGTTTNVNLGLSRSEDYCQNNPSLVVSRFVADAQNGIYAANNVLTDFPYNAGTNYTDTTVGNYDLPSTHSVGVIASRVGTVFSLAYSRVNRRVYAAAYFKRHAGFGPGADGTFNTSDDPGAAAEWRQWEATIQADFSFPQPMLTDIEFENDNLILGLRDREGDQALDNGPDAKRTAGDTLRGCGAMGAWIMESNGRCGSPATGTAPQGTGQGLGNGEFYHQDDFCTTPNGGNYHDELAWGELIYIPGRQHVITTLLDPISRTISSGATFDGGFRWFNNTTGNTDRAYRLYNGTGGPDVPDFGKANGLGGVTAMCSLAPIEIGNRVWRDLNNNGAQDPQESRAATSPVLMSGITVRLYNSSNTLVATAVTDQDGEYYFSSGAGTNTGNAIYNLNLLPNTQYQVRFDNPANYTSGGPLFGLSLTSVNQTSQNGDDDSSDSDASNVTNPVGSPSAGTFPVISLTTGAAGSNNHTFDVGFAPPAPSAADVIVGGRVTTAFGMGIPNTTVTLSDMTSTRRTALTNAFGYFQFTGVQAGQTVIVTVLSKRYHFSQPSLAVDAGEDIFDVNFVADN